VIREKGEGKKEKGKRRREKGEISTAHREF
jgi:hypothetical protein